MCASGEGGTYSDAFAKGTALLTRVMAICNTELYEKLNINLHMLDWLSFLCLKVNLSAAVSASYSAFLALVCDIYLQYCPQQW